MKLRNYPLVSVLFGYPHDGGIDTFLTKIDMLYFYKSRKCFIYIYIMLCIVLAQCEKCMMFLAMYLEQADCFCGCLCLLYF